MNETVQNAITQAEGVFNALAPVVAAAIPAAAPVVEGVQAAETVESAVVANAPHHTAVSDIAAGLTALAGTPIVQGNPAVAAKLTGLALLWHDLLGLL